MDDSLAAMFYAKNILQNLVVFSDKSKQFLGFFILPVQLVCMFVKWYWKPQLQ